ncbi:hypothetical protein ACP4OV_026857 [Aristida adscensionis]
MRYLLPVGNEWNSRSTQVAATPAVTKIMQDRPDVAVEVLPPGAPLTPGLNLRRVRVFIDFNGLVTKIPFTG